MTKEELNEYLQLKEEIVLLKNKISELENREAQYSSDIVKGSSKHFPYTEHPIKLYGYDSEYEKDIIKSIERKKIRLKRLKLQREKEAEKLYEYINTRKESRTRQVLIYTYIDGKTQNDIAKIMHIDRSLVSKIIKECIK